MLKTLKYLLDISPSKREIRMQLKREFGEKISDETINNLANKIYGEFKKIKTSSMDKATYSSYKLKICKYETKKEQEQAEYENATYDSPMFTFCYITVPALGRLIISTVYYSKYVVLSYVA